MTNSNSKILKIMDALVERELANVGRWAELTMKKTGETLTLIRTGYGPMEYPERDSHILKDSNGNIICKANDLFGIAQYIFNAYC